MPADPIPNSRPWWLGPGPVAFMSLIGLACAVIVWQGVVAARRPTDVRDRNAELIRTGSFCDPPSGTPGTVAPPATQP